MLDVRDLPAIRRCLCMDGTHKAALPSPAQIANHDEHLAQKWRLKNTVLRPWRAKLPMYVRDAENDRKTNTTAVKATVLAHRGRGGAF